MDASVNKLDTEKITAGNSTPEERKTVLDHPQCEGNFAKEQVEEMKTQMDINPWLQNSENLSNFNDFWDEIWCHDSESHLEKLNEATKVFFENEEGREDIPYTLNPDYLGFQAGIEGHNKKLIFDLLNKNLEALGLDPKNVNKDTFTDNKKDELKKKFEEDVNNAQTTVINGMHDLAKKFRDQDPDNTKEPTFSPDELRKYGHDIDVLYMLAHGGENKDFADRLFVNLGKLSEDEKRKDLLSLYCETDALLDTETDAPEKNTEKVVAASMRLTWIQREMQNLDYEEQKIWLKEYIEDMNPARTDAALNDEIDNIIKNRVVWLGAASEVFKENQEYADRFPMVSQRITDGIYDKNQRVTEEDIRQGKTEGIFQEKINAVEVLTRCPLQSALGAYLTFAGSMGILLNVLANKGLLKDNIAAFATNPALGISTLYLGLGLEMVTGEKGIGSGIVADMLGKLRGDAFDENISNQKIMELWEDLRSYPAIRRYTEDHFEEIKTYMDEKQKEIQQIQEQQEEETRSEENVPKSFEEFIKQDLEEPADGQDNRPEFIKNLTGMDSFSTEETLVKIAGIYSVSTHFKKSKINTQGEFKDFVDFLLNPDKHRTS